MYIVLVLLQTLLLPLLTGSLQLAVAGGDPFVVYGVWFAFWGVGTRLLVAGISQLVNPGRTAEGILGIEDAGAEQVVHELAFANLALGVAALAVPFAPAVAIAAAVPGALYLGLAGFRHVAKRGKGVDETVATWTDVLVFLAVAIGVIAMIAA